MLIFFIVGRAVRVQHIRIGKELKEVVYDNNYDFNFQVRALQLLWKSNAKEDPHILNDQFSISFADLVILRVSYKMEWYVRCNVYDDLHN